MRNQLATVFSKVKIAPPMTTAIKMTIFTHCNGNVRNGYYYTTLVVVNNSSPVSHSVFWHNNPYCPVAYTYICVISSFNTNVFTLTIIGVIWYAKVWSMRCHCIAVNIVSRYGFETPLTALLNARTFYSKRHSDFGASTPIQFRIFQDFAISHVSKIIKSVHKGFRILCKSGKLTRLSMTKTQGRCTKITLFCTLQQPKTHHGNQLSFWRKKLLLSAEST